MQRKTKRKKCKNTNNAKCKLMLPAQTFHCAKKNHANLRIMQKMHILKLLDNAKKADYKFACFPPEINQTNLRTWHRGTCTELVHHTTLVCLI